MATNRITYGQSAIAVSQPPANSDNTYNLTGLKRVQSASIDFAFAKKRFKQLSSTDFAGEVQLRNADIGFNVDYLYSNGTNEALMGLEVDGSTRGIVNYAQKENQDRNYYIIMGTGDSQEPNMLDTAAQFKNKFNVMALGNVFLNSYTLSAGVGSLVSVSAGLSAYNVVMNAYNDANDDGETIPAIDTTKTGPAEPVTDKQYTITTGVFQNTTNRDGNITSAFAVGDIELILPVVKEPGLEFTGSDRQGVRRATLDSFNLSFELQREDLYGLGSLYPYGRRALLPTIGGLNFTALATEFTTGNLNSFLSGSHAYDFHINLVNPSGQTGLQIAVEGAQMTKQGIQTNIGGNAQFQAGFDLSISPTSGLKISTPPLVIGQPVANADVGAILYIQATGRTSTDTSVYNADGFKYEWYKDAANIGAAGNERFCTAGSAGTYYAVVTNELGSATTNNSVVS